MQKKRKRSFIRKVNQRWQSEYGKFERNSPKNVNKIISDPKMAKKTTKDDSDSFIHVYRDNMLEEETEQREIKGSNERHSFNSKEEAIEFLCEDQEC